MSDPPKKPARPPSAASTGKFDPLLRWRSIAPERGEAVRWLRTDGRWITVTLGQDDEVGTVVVRSSEGVVEKLDSYEDALALAKKWRS